MLRYLATIGLGYLFVAGLGIYLEDFVGRRRLHAALRGWLAARRAAVARACAELLPANTQHRFHVGKLEPRDVEQFGNALHGEPGRTLHVDAFERRADLDFEEHAQQV